MKCPENIDGILDNVQAFHSQIRAMALTLPPTPAKTVIDDLLSKVEPLVDQFREVHVEAKTALEKQDAENRRQFEQVKKDFAAVEEKFAQLPPVDVIKKNLVPLAAALPAGLSIKFADEMMHRYAAQAKLTPESDHQAAAWQDWTVPS